MARNFSVSAIFSAVNRLTAPVAQMGQQISRFAQAVRTASTSAGSSLGNVGSAANLLRNVLSRLNNINFNNLTFQLRNLRGRMQDASAASRQIGQGLLLGVGGTIAAGYAVGKTLDPVRDYESVRNSLGTLYAKPGASKADVYKAGEEQYKTTQEMALRLPGEVKDFAVARRMTKNFGVEGTEDMLRGFTDMAGAAGKEFNAEFVQGLQQGVSGNDVDILKGLGIKFGSEKGHTKITDINNNNKETFFKTPGDALKWLSLRGSTKYKGGTERAMESAAGMESNVSDALSAAQVNLWKDTGALDLYKSKLGEITEAIKSLGVSLKPIVTAIVDFANKHKDLVTNLMIGIPVIAALGVAAMALSAIFAGLALIFSPIALGIALIAVIIADVILIYKKWDSITQSVTETIAEGWSWLANTVKTTWESIKDAAIGGVTGLIAAVVDAFNELYQSAIAKTAEWIGIGVQFVANIWEGVKGGITGLITAVVDAFNKLYQSAIAKTAEWIGIGVQFVANIWEGVKSSWGEFKNWILTAFADIAASVPVIGTNLSNTIKTNVNQSVPTTAQPASNSAQAPSTPANSSALLTNQQPNINIGINQTHNVTPSGVNTVSKTNASGGNVKLANTGQSKRTAGFAKAH